MSVDEFTIRRIGERRPVIPKIQPLSKIIGSLNAALTQFPGSTALGCGTRHLRSYEVRGGQRRDSLKWFFGFAVGFGVPRYLVGPVQLITA